MAKIFDADFRTGSLANKVTGEIGTITPAGSSILRNGDKGMELCSGNIYNTFCYVEYSNAPSHNGDLTVELWFNTFDYILSSFWNVLFFRTGLNCYFNSDMLYFGRGGTTMNTINLNTYGLPLNKYHHLIITSTSTGITSIYIDNILLGGPATIPIVEGSGSLQVNKSKSGNLKRKMGLLRMYNHIFTEQERANSYRDFLNSYPIVKEKYPNVVNKPTDLSREKDNTLSSEILVSDATYGVTANNISHWMAYGTNTIIQEGNAVKTTYVDNTQGSYVGYFRTQDNIVSRNFVAGDKIRILFKAKKTGNGNVVIKYTDGGGATNIATITSDSYTLFQATVTYISGTPYISFTTFGAGNVCWIEMISMVTITGLVAAYNMIPNGSTLVDISGNGKNNTLSNFTTTKNGITSNKNLTVGTTTILPKFTLALKGNISLVGTGSFGLLSFVSGAANNALYFTNSYLYYRGDSAAVLAAITSNYTTLFGSNSTVVITGDGTTLTVYKNGVIFYQGVLANTNLGADSFWGTWAGALPKTKDLYSLEDLRIYNRAWTETEVKAYHNQFVQPTLIEDFSTEGADGVAKVPSGWVKQSGSFKIGEVTGATKGNLISNGSFDTGITGWSGSYETIEWDSVNKRLHVASPTGGVKFMGWTSGTTFYAGRTYKISLSASGSTTSKVLANGIGGGVIFTLTGGVTYYSPTTTQKLYFEFYTTAGGVPVDFYLDDVSIEDVTIPTIVNGTKYLECVTDGAIEVMSKLAYGTWEWDWYKGADANTTTFSLTAKKQYNTTDYSVYINASESLRLNKKVDGANTVLFNTSNAYLSNFTWYRIKLTRTTAGAFTIYIKGGAFGSTDWTLIPATGGSNPVIDTVLTDSNYAICFFGAGDRIANINFYDGIKQ